MPARAPQSITSALSVSSISADASDAEVALLGAVPAFLTGGPSDGWAGADDAVAFEPDELLRDVVLPADAAFLGQMVPSVVSALSFGSLARDVRTERRRQRASKADEFVLDGVLPPGAAMPARAPQSITSALS
eukprot:7103838-Prymnesium_polylepis.1